MTDSIKKVVNIFAVLFLSVGFLGSGMLCLVNYHQLVAAFEQWGYSHIFMYSIGIIEIGTAVMLYHKPWRRFGMILALLVMLGAIFTHIKSNEFNQLYGPLVVLTLLATLFFTETNEVKK